jgi:hypothetical protein
MQAGVPMLARQYQAAFAQLFASRACSGQSYIRWRLLSVNSIGQGFICTKLTMSTVTVARCYGPHEVKIESIEPQ